MNVASICCAAALSVVLSVVSMTCRAAGGESGESRASYAASCAAAIGSLADFDCRDGEIVPITVNGEDVRDRIPPDCDHPPRSGEDAEWPDGRCVPFSRVLLLREGDVQAVAICRRKRLRPIDDPRFEEINLILHGRKSGSTCWFAATRPEAPPHQDRHTAPFDAAHVPAPTSAAAADYWDPPEQIAGAGCGVCHDNNPYMFSPYIGQVWRLMPTDPFGRYANDIGEAFASWPKLASMTPTGNTCTGCHRIGITTTCKAWFLELIDAVPRQFPKPGSNLPFSYSMPLLHGFSPEAWRGLNGTSVAAIERCCELAGKGEPAPECHIAPIPGGSHPAGRQ